jgi:hypothetical protein
VELQLGGGCKRNSGARGDEARETKEPFSNGSKLGLNKRVILLIGSI